jgi:hypothetical protein
MGKGRFFVMKRWTAGFFLVCLLGLTGLTGCGNNKVTGDGQQIKQYDNDGYLGLSNTNPNLPGTYSHHTYQDDVRLIHQAAISVPGVKDTRVTLGNAVAHVRLKLADDVPKQEIERIKQAALSAITYNMPRYTVTVSTGD